MNSLGKRSMDDMMEDPSKKPRMNNLAPSKVLHIRNLPCEVTEQELLQLAIPFGHVERILILRPKPGVAHTQGFVQMEDVSQSMAMQQFYSGTMPALVRGRTAYFQFSSRPEISSTSTSANNQNDQPNHIVLVTISNVLYPITVDVLHQVFMRYGQIVKIVVFQKTGLQALVQYDNINSAVAAKQLDGENIYANCCTLNIQFSNLQNITVKFNNDRSRDYTNPGLPTSHQDGGAPGGHGGPGGPNQSMLGMPQMGGPGGMGGGMGGGKFGGGGPPGVDMYGNPQFGAPPGGMYGQQGGQQGMPGMPMGGNNSPVLICGNLDEEKTNPDIIFTLFGIYGDVQRVKILYNKKSTCLIQFANSQHSETAMANLNGCPFFGKKLTVNFSKHQSVAQPRPFEGEAGTEESDQSNLTKDYFGSPLHRFKNPGSKNYQNIAAPNPVLHLSNLPEGITEEEIKAMFGQYGGVEDFKFFEKDHRMALIKLASTEEAVWCVINMHNHQVGDNNIRVSFSKSSINNRNADGEQQ